MIFYTLQGPSSKLEIHEESIRLIKRNWLSVFSRQSTHNEWEINELSSFQITVPKFMMISGKIEWQTFDGRHGTFRFTTTPAMVKKIETYLQKRIIKNHQKVRTLESKKETGKTRRAQLAA